MPREEPAARKAAEAVLVHAAARSRMLDDHMYKIRYPNGAVRTTFRLQLFTADGQRPVAVATQMTDEGASLTNAAETCATTVWRQFFPTEPEPPIWIERSLSESGPPHVAYVEFATDTEHNRLRHPKWRFIEDVDLDLLVRQPVDRGRGAGYIPPEPTPEDLPRYKVCRVAKLPRPNPFRTPSCMPGGIPWWRRLLRQVVPGRTIASCCWYHEGNWHAVSEAAIQLVRAANAANIHANDIETYVKEQAAADPALSRWERQALSTLVSPWEAIQLSEDGREFINGQHRAQAMLDAGVRRTVVVYWDAPDADTVSMQKGRG